MLTTSRHREPVPALSRIATLAHDAVLSAECYDCHSATKLGGFRSVHNGRDHNIYSFTVLVAGQASRPA
jgi:hypothetical protein